MCVRVSGLARSRVTINTKPNIELTINNAALNLSRMLELPFITRLHSPRYSRARNNQHSIQSHTNNKIHSVLLNYYKKHTCNILSFYNIKIIMLIKWHFVFHFLVPIKLGIHMYTYTENSLTSILIQYR